MKHVKKLIKLANLNSEDLNEKKLNLVTGGHTCGCYYELCGGSSTVDNDAANAKIDAFSLTPGAGEWGYT